MNLRRPVPPLKIPPGKLNIEDFLRRLVASHEELRENIFNPGDLVASSLQFIVIAESGSGLQVGSVYVDADGFLKLVRASDIFAPSFSVRVHLGTVTTAA